MDENVVEMKKERTIEDIQIEYGKLCTLAGQNAYQIYALQLDIDVMNSKMRELNLEAAELKAKEAAKEQEKA
jgi:ribosome biogenesis GTPase A